MSEPNVTISERGFKNMDPVPGAYGGEVRVYESSAAMHPHIWLYISEPDDLNEFARKKEKYDGTFHEAHSHLRLEDAIKLRDQLTYLIESHYHFQ